MPASAQLSDCYTVCLDSKNVEPGNRQQIKEMGNWYVFC